jgi:hypothetical protein
MGAVDIANQLRESYEVHRASVRNWWPLFYWLIDVTIINSYRLYLIVMEQLGMSKTLSHREFRTCIYMSLFSYITDAKLAHLRESLGGKRRFLSTDFKIHFRVNSGQKQCVWCMYLLQRARLKGEKREGAIKRTRSECSFCNVALCTQGSCWSDYHNIYDY